MTVNSRTERTRSRGGAIALAAATATVLGATAFALPASALSDAGSGAAASDAKAAAGIPLKNGTLDWGIKKSFRDYLTGPIANGEITVADGAKTNEDGSFRFTDGTGSYDTGTHAVTTAFKGSVHLYGHEGKLDLKLSDLKVVTEGKSGSLSADVDKGTGKDGSGKPEESKDDVELATLDLTDVKPGTGEGGEMTFAGIPASLTEAGSEAFDKYYPAGEKLDPASLAVTPASSGGANGSNTAGGSANGGNAGSGNGGSTSTGSTSGGSGDGGTTDGGSGGSAGPGDEKPASGEIADGNLDWGVKASFRKYVKGPIAKGKIEMSDGAKTTKSGYRFPKGSGDYQPDDLNAAFKGGVRFLGHKESGSYTLDLTLSHFRVEAAGTKGNLVADVRSKDRESGKVSTYDGLSVASLKLKSGALDPEKDVVSLKDVPATLTEDGAKAFAGFYEEGEKLDPVTAAVSLDENAELPGAGDGGSDSGSGSGGAEPASVGGAGTVGGSGDSGALASTGTGLPSASVMGGALTLAALGGAAVYAARRRTGGAATPNES
ncbi:HtaA domain-containing protein [Streptomyces sp. NBC_01187]|uniref:HtaA domain-containing protein n=1 Tax=Streptomyces sp. NBC_01187 TaxID=2903766 RepID=UPI0038640F97|nr:HtaA domain-containing protein [Streptomyces sp. NBC_01187]